MPRLIVVSGPDKGKHIDIGEAPVKIGHSSERDFALDDDRVSRLHAVAERREGRTILRDMNSSNGTFVNDEFITEVRLQHNDHIVMGDTNMKYIAESEVFPEERRVVKSKGKDRPSSEKNDSTVILMDTITETEILPGEDDDEEEIISEG